MGPDTPVLAGSGADLAWRRLHPWGVARELGNFAPGVFFLVAFGRSGRGGGWFDVAEVAFGALLVVAAIARHQRRRYAITADTLLLRHGLVNHQEQVIERRRIQNVSRVTPRLYRYLGITTVTVTESSGRASISLSPVSTAVADELMATLDADRPARTPDAAPGPSTTGPSTTDSSTTEPATTGPSAPEGPSPDVVDPLDGPGRVEIGVPWPQVAVVRCTTANYLAVFLLPLGLIDRRAFIIVGGFLALSVLISASTTFANAKFRLVANGGRVRTSAGPLTETAQVISTDNLQWVRARRWLIHRLLGYEVVTFSTAEGSTGVEDQLAPAWPLGTWPELARLVVTPLQATEADLDPISPRTVTRFRIYGIVATAVLLAVAVEIPPLLLAAAVLAPVVIWWYPRQRYRRFGIGLVGDQLITRTGAIVEKVHLTTLGRIEGAVVSQSPGQRRRGMASLQFTGVGLQSTITVPDLHTHDAHTWAERLVTEADRRFLSSAPSPDLSPHPALLDQHLPNETVPLWRLHGLLEALGAMALLAVPSIAVAVTRFDNLPTVPVAVIVGAGVVIAAASWLLVPRYHRAWRWHADHTWVATEFSIVLRQRQIVQRRSIQSLRVSSGFLERRYGLRSLTAHVAGDNADLAIPHLRPDTIQHLEERLRSPTSGTR